MSASVASPAIGCAALPACGEPARRELLRASGTLNGIDFVEVGDDGVTLCVHLFGDIPAGIGVADVRISGGSRITGLHARSVATEHESEMHDDACLRVVLDREGDYTPYCLCLVDAATSGDDPATWTPYPGFDPRYACATLRFRLGCGVAQDCAAGAPCITPPVPAPEINYLAKDYASFRQLFLDRLAQTMPGWTERHVPDLGIALVEVLAYTADYLSYYQDAVASEAYLATARKRISVRRHARLVDYRLHEGCNARALVTLASESNVTLPLDNLLLLVPPGANATRGVIDATQLAKARAQGALIYEPMARDGATTLNVVAAHTAIRIYTWGDEACCLPRGSTRATLVDVAAPASARDVPSASPAPTSPVAAATAAPLRALALAVGDLLIFEEVLGPQTGNPADADPAHRCAVRLTAVEPSQDPLTGTPLVEIAWDACDALPFDLCLSVRKPPPDCAWLHDVSLARGNVLLVDHGEHVPLACQCAGICQPTGSDGDYPGLAAALAGLPDACTRCDALAEDCWLVPGSIERGCCRCEGAVQDVRRPPATTGHALPVAPLTFAEPLPPDAPVCQLLARDPRAALPQLTVYGGPLADVLVAGAPDARWRWQARYDLLESAPDARDFAVEVDDDGVAHLRFGDGVLGLEPQAGDFFRAAPRVGNGTAGNAGADSIVWLALKSGALSGSGIVPRNPLPAAGGTAAESIAEAKLYAPGAFRANPLRAIIADDYATFAARDPALQGAACELAWTGSWYEAHVVADPLGREDLPADLAARILAGLWPYRRIGHAVAVSGACYVPITVVLSVCVRPEFLQAHVEAELGDRFTSGLPRDGTPGFFHPDRLLLGEPVYASAILAEAQAVTGVAHVELAMLARMEGPVPARDGVLKIGPREIARCDSDPDYPDHGSITFDMRGGR